MRLARVQSTGPLRVVAPRGAEAEHERLIQRVARQERCHRRRARRGIRPAHARLLGQGQRMTRLLLVRETARLEELAHVCQRAAPPEIEPDAQHSRTAHGPFIVAEQRGGDPFPPSAAHRAAAVGEALVEVFVPGEKPAPAPARTTGVMRSSLCRIPARTGGTPARARADWRR